MNGYSLVQIEKIFEWFYVGKIVFDRNEYIEKIKQELEDFPFQGKEIEEGT